MSDEPFGFGERGRCLRLEGRQCKTSGERGHGARHDRVVGPIGCPRGRLRRRYPRRGDNHSGAGRGYSLRLSADRRHGNPRRPQQVKRSGDDVREVDAGGNENLPAGEGSEMTDIGFQAVLADKHDRKPPSAAGEVLDIERMNSCHP